MTGDGERLFAGVDTEVLFRKVVNNPSRITAGQLNQPQVKGMWDVLSVMTHATVEASEQRLPWSGGPQSAFR